MRVTPSLAICVTHFTNRMYLRYLLDQIQDYPVLVYCVDFDIQEFLREDRYAHIEFNNLTSINQECLWLTESFSFPDHITSILILDAIYFAALQMLEHAKAHGLSSYVYLTEVSFSDLEESLSAKELRASILNNADEILLPGPLHGGIKIDLHTHQNLRFCPVNQNLRMRSSSKNEVLSLKDLKKTLSITPDDTVILIPRPVDETYDFLKIFLAIKTVITRNDQKIKVLVLGEDLQARSIHLAAYHVGLGDRVLFFHKNIEFVKESLVSLCHIVILPQPLLPSLLSGDLEAWEAMQHGAYGLIDPHSWVADPQSNQQSFSTLDNMHNLVMKIEHAIETKPFYPATLAPIQALTLVDLIGLSSFSKPIKDKIFPEGSFFQALANFQLSHLDKFDRDTLKNGNKENLMTQPSPKMIMLHQAYHAYNQYDYKVALDLFEGVLRRVRSRISSSTPHTSIPPKGLLALKGLGFCWWKLHEHDDALKAFKEVYALDGHDHEAMYGIGLVFLRLDLKKEALYWLKKHLIYAPKHAQLGLIPLIQICQSSFVGDQGLTELMNLKALLGDLPILVDAIDHLETKHTGFLRRRHLLKAI